MYKLKPNELHYKGAEVYGLEIPEDIALEILRRGPAEAERFESLPDGWEAKLSEPEKPAPKKRTKKTVQKTS